MQLKPQMPKRARPKAVAHDDAVDRTTALQRALGTHRRPRPGARRNVSGLRRGDLGDRCAPSTVDEVGPAVYLKLVIGHDPT